MRRLSTVAELTYYTLSVLILTTVFGVVGAFRVLAWFH